MNTSHSDTFAKQYLNESTRYTFGERVIAHRYDRLSLARSIVHISTGGFHRAHQLVYFDDLASQGEQGWGVTGVGLREERNDRGQLMKDVLERQNCLYTVVERDENGARARIIGSMVGYLYAPDDPEPVLTKLRDSHTKLITLTITEQGYPVDEVTLEFKRDHPTSGIVEDLADPTRRTTVFSYLFETFSWLKNNDPDRRLAVLSCDNLPRNGDITRTAIVGYAEARGDKELSEWIAKNENLFFPNCMVDRITPKTTADDREMVSQQFGIIDAWPVVTEPFRQWVIQTDERWTDRPPLERLTSTGLLLTDDVDPYDRMKLRLLNASHSAMGYLGTLHGGYRTIDAVIGTRLFERFITAMMTKEVRPLLDPPQDIDLTAYITTLIDRFRNRTIADPLSRICEKGSAKMPKFVIPSLREALAANPRKPPPLLTLAVAGWLCYLSGRNDDLGQAIVINDPQGDELQKRVRHGKENRRPDGHPDPGPVLAMERIFGSLGKNYDVWVDLLAEMMHSLDTLGTRHTLLHYLAQEA